MRAAELQFAEHGYAGTSLRAIARDAGVDASMVSHYFGSKAGLYGAVAKWPVDPAKTISTILKGGSSEVGHRIAESFINQWATTEWRNPLITLAAAATDDAAAAILLRTFLLDQLLVPVLDGLEIDHPRERAGLISSTLIGVGLGRYVLGLADSETIPDQTLVASLTPHLQRLCTDPLNTR